MKKNILFYFFIFYSISIVAQETVRKAEGQCGTMDRLEQKFKSDPALKTRFEQKRNQFNKFLREGSFAAARRDGTGSNQRVVYTIPIVFHIVLPNRRLLLTGKYKLNLIHLTKRSPLLTGIHQKFHLTLNLFLATPA
jgi:hypothetical protein